MGDDVVQHGREPRGDGPPNALRLVALVLAVLAVGFLLSRSGLLSADAPEETDRIGGPTGFADRAGRLVARVDDHLVRLGQTDWSEGARLPEGLLPDAPLVPVLAGSGTSTLLGVHDGLLFRVSTTRTARWQPIGRAERVVAASAVPGRAFVLRSGELVEVDVATGRVTQPSPFPGFEAAAGWRPADVLPLTGTRALLMSRQSAEGSQQELALAWLANPPQQVLGSFGPLLGVADDSILTTTPGACPGRACRVRIVTVTRDDVLVRDVAPPEGWTFAPSPSAGRTHKALVLVQRLDDETVRGLARLVPGGDNALLVQGTSGIDVGAGLADALDGSVYLVTRKGSDGPARLRVWRPDRPSRAQAVARGEGALPLTARLVCACG